MRQPRIVDLESGERNPRIEALLDQIQSPAYQRSRRALLTLLA